MTDEEVTQIFSAAYWNDVEEEQKKSFFWVEGGAYDRCLEYLESTKLLAEYQRAESFIRDLRRGGLVVADLAAGIGWTSALLSKIDQVGTVHSVEISRHRLERLFPHCVEMLDADATKIHRYLGSFYDLRFPAASIDVVFLCHAFHHADNPLKLLDECARVLKSDGRIIVVGEHRIRAAAIARRFLSLLLRERKLITDFREMFPPDPVLGDHYYRHRDYQAFFAALGYGVRHVVAPTGYVIYVAERAARA
jgi:ubiquinone/menaquinone biosynthesis C-methylase UbiE